MAHEGGHQRRAKLGLAHKINQALVLQSVSLEALAGSDRHLPALDGLSHFGVLGCGGS